MDIIQRTVNAVAIYNTLAMCGPSPKLVSQTVMASDACDLPAQPNVIYMGASEWREWFNIRGVPFGSEFPKVIMGMRIIRVELENWLQVTYVGGAK